MEKRKLEARNVLTLNEAANYLKVCRQTLVKRVRAGELPCVIVGKQYRFFEDVLRRESEREGNRP